MALGHANEAIPDDLLGCCQAFMAYLRAANSNVLSSCQLLQTLADMLLGRSPHKGPRGVHVIAGTSAAQRLYMIVSKEQVDHNVKYRVMMNDVLTVNQVIREGVVRSTYGIADMLLKNGIAFKTLRTYLHPMQDMLASPPFPMFTMKVLLGLGVRQRSEGAFTLKNYDLYLEQ